MGKDWSYLRHTVTQNPALVSHLPSTRGAPNVRVIRPYYKQKWHQLFNEEQDNGKVEERKATAREEER